MRCEGTGAGALETGERRPGRRTEAAATRWFERRNDTRRHGLQRGGQLASRAGSRGAEERRIVLTSFDERSGPIREWN